MDSAGKREEGGNLVWSSRDGVGGAELDFIIVTEGTNIGFQFNKLLNGIRSIFDSIKLDPYLRLMRGDKGGVIDERCVHAGMISS